MVLNTRCPVSDAFDNSVDTYVAIWALSHPTLTARYVMYVS